MTDTANQPPENPSRRGFVSALGAGIAALIGGYPLIRALAEMPPASMDVSEEPWVLLVPAGEVETIAPGKPKRADLTRVVAERWRVREEKVALYVVRGEAEALTVFSSICTHAGCVVGFEAKENRFHCPCHDGYFGIDGRVLDGPPPRGLDPIPHRLTEAGLEVRFTRYRLDTAERIEL